MRKRDDSISILTDLMILPVSVLINSAFPVKFVCTVQAGMSWRTTETFCPELKIEINGCWRITPADIFNAG